MKKVEINIIQVVIYDFKTQYQLVQVFLQVLSL